MDNLKFKIELGDITTYQVDAVVNAAKYSLMGGGGVDGAIHSAAGPELLAECITLGKCPTGEAKITKGYRLPCQYVIHAVGPRVTGYEPTEEDKQLLKSAYRNALLLANEYKCETVALSAISTGVHSFDPKIAAPIAINEILTFLNSEENQSIKQAIMVCYTEYVKDFFDEALHDFYHKSKENLTNGIPYTPSPIVLFYLNQKPDHKGRYLLDIWNYGNIRLEMIHDYIQWMFPTNEESTHYTKAPVLTEEDMQYIQKNKTIQNNMLFSFQKLLCFYGFENAFPIRRSANFINRQKHWLTKNNHNFLRITRILKSLRCFGLNEYADSFFLELKELYERYDVIDEETFKHWKNAVGFNKTEKKH